MEIAALIGAISGLVSLIMIGYTLGVWRGTINTKVDTLWKIYVEDELVRQRAQDRVGASEWYIKETGEATLPDDMKEDIKQLTQAICSKPWPLSKQCNPDIVPSIVKKLGLARIRKVAENQAITVHGVVALIYVYSKKVTQNRKDNQ